MERPESPVRVRSQADQLGLLDPPDAEDEPLESLPDLIPAGFHDDMPLAAARAQVLRLRADGVGCPCCGQFAKVYRRKVNSSMARGLIAAWHAFGTDFGYLQDVRRASKATDNREEPKFRYWGLMEEEPSLRPDGGRAGWWRVTPRGVAWLKREISVPKYALIYDGDLLGFEGEHVYITDAIGTKFNYADLMAGV